MISVKWHIIKIIGLSVILLSANQVSAQLELVEDSSRYSVNTTTRYSTSFATSSPNSFSDIIDLINYLERPPKDEFETQIQYRRRIGEGNAQFSIHAFLKNGDLGEYSHELRGFPLKALMHSRSAEILNHRSCGYAGIFLMTDFWKPTIQISLTKPRDELIKYTTLPIYSRHEEKFYRSGPSHSKYEWITMDDIKNLIWDGGYTISPKSRYCALFINMQNIETARALRNELHDEVTGLPIIMDCIVKDIRYRQSDDYISKKVKDTSYPQGYRLERLNKEFFWIELHVEVTNFKLEWNGGYPITSLDKIAQTTNNSDFESHFRIGESFFNNKQYDEAMKSYKAAIQINPNSKNSHYRLGGCYLKFENYEMAMNEFEAVIKIDSGYLNAYWNLGVSAAHLQKYDKERRAWQEYLRLAKAEAKRIKAKGKQNKKLYRRIYDAKNRLKILKEVLGDY